MEGEKKEKYAKDRDRDEYVLKKRLLEYFYERSEFLGVSSRSKMCTLCIVQHVSRLIDSNIFVHEGCDYLIRYSKTARGDSSF
jgi:hypothetical protein